MVKVSNILLVIGQQEIQQSRDKRKHETHNQLPYSTKLWREKTLVELELLENWWRKLWRLAEEKPIHY